VYFETIGVYPAARVLHGYLLALLGLLDLASAGEDSAIGALARQSHETFHELAAGYDLGYWSSYDLLNRRPASLFHHTLHIALLRALGHRIGCASCDALASRWEAYPRSRVKRLRRALTVWRRRNQEVAASRRMARVQRRTSGAGAAADMPTALAAISAFPFAGGMRSVLIGVERVMAGEWHMEYLTRRVGTDADRYTIYPYQRQYRFLGPEATSPSHYPNALLYGREGKRVISRLLRERRYDVVLPQDGVFTAAYLAPVAKRYGTPVVTMDHGSVTKPESAVYLSQRAGDFARRRQPRRTIERIRFALYLPMIRHAIRSAVRASDTFLVAGDEVQDIYVKSYGVSSGVIVRYPYWIDATALAPLDERERCELRARLRLPERPVIIALISRLTEEKGFDLALEAISKALEQLGPDAAQTCGIVIAGSGPLRKCIEADLLAHGLTPASLMWGEASRGEVIDLLRASDIFLYAGKRGTNYSVAVLEAMAAGLATVATTEPISNVRLLAEGRGIALSNSAGAGEMAAALARLIPNPDLRREMAIAAREYVERHHSALALRQALWRATGWTPPRNAFLGLTAERVEERGRA
jgi:glycosyltransferase involved in cell wall biosynthesis